MSNTSAVVLGGQGYLGSRLVDGLQRCGWAVATAGRSSGDVRVDVTAPETFDALSTYDVVINCTDTTRADPGPVAVHTLSRGARFVETTSDRVAMQSVVEVGRTAGGAVLAGAGIFPGVSNVVAADAASGTSTSVMLGLRWSPISGGGAGMANLVPHLLATPTRSVSGSSPVDGPPAAPGPRLPFASGTRATAHIPFSEPELLHQSLGIADSMTFMAPRPGILRAVFAYTPMWFYRIPGVLPAMGAFMRVVRRALAGSTTAVEMVAVAQSSAGAMRSTLEVDDGMHVCGLAGAALIERFVEDGRSGVVYPDQLGTLEQLLLRIRELDPEVVVRSSHGPCEPVSFAPQLLTS